MSDFIFLHQQKIILRFLKLLKPLTFSEVNLNIDMTDASHIKCSYKQNVQAHFSTQTRNILAHENPAK